LIGYGLSGDALPHHRAGADGDGAFRCMQAAIKRAGLSPGISTTSTPTARRPRSADEIELGAVQRVVGNAAGAHFHVLDQILHRPPAGRGRRGGGDLLDPGDRDRVAPPHINLDNPSVETPIDLVPHQARKRDIDTALSNSFGFGGTNASLIFPRYAEP